MKKRILLLTLAVAGLFLVTPTQSQARLPGIDAYEAYEQTISTLRQVAFWRYRDAGYVDCRRGKINRTTWSCRFTIVKGQKCQRGRSQVRSDYFPNGEYGWFTHIRSGPRYSCVGV